MSLLADVMFRRLAIATFFAIIFWGSFFAGTASSQLVESRLSNLESDLNRLESRLVYIESQLGRSGSSPPSRTTPTPSLPSRPRRNQTQQQRDQMFDRLATLFVELKEQVNTLEKRVIKLESR